MAMECAAAGASNAAAAAAAQAPLDQRQQCEMLQSFYGIASIDKAWASPSRRGRGIDVVVAMSQVNLPENKKRAFVSCVHVPEPDEEPGSSCCYWSPFPFELGGAAVTVPSPSGEKMLVVYNAESGKESTRLQIWGALQLLSEIFVPAKLHGAIFTDGWFEGVAWSHDENYIAYVAEEPSPSRPVFGGDNKDDAEAAGAWKGQGDWVEDWGECYTGKRRPTIFVADTNSGTVQAVQGVPGDLSVGQVVWAPPPSNDEPQHLVFVGWTCLSENFNTPRRLGMKYCYNRPCGLYAAEAPAFGSGPDSSPSTQKSSLVKLTSGITSAFSPRFSPDGKYLVFLSAKAAVDSGAHCATNSLHCIQWPGPAGVSRSSALPMKDIVPVVMRPDDKGFPGLYCSSFISHPWLPDNRTLVLSSVWRSIQVIVFVSLESGKVLRVTPQDSINSWNLLSVRENLLVAVTSSPGGPPSLKFTYCSLECNEPLDWTDISTPVNYTEKVQTILSAITTEILQIPVPTSENVLRGAKEPFEAILMRPGCLGKDSDPAPLVLVLHGGPHSVSLTGFSRTSVFLLSLGFSLLHVNYRGSLGFGEEAVQSLLGNVGRQDVDDVLAALDAVIAKGFANPDKVAVIGGSHGGFLTSHLIGQAPERFVAAVLRNPVCNISSMVGITDIPDWCFMESYGKAGLEKYTEAPTVTHLGDFYQASPIAHVDKVKAPTLFLLGAQDRRVPVSNGLQYAQALRARGLEVKILVFPEDTHAIDRPQSEFESFLNVGVWLTKFF